MFAKNYSYISSVIIIKTNLIFQQWNTLDVFYNNESYFAFGKTKTMTQYLERQQSMKILFFNHSLINLFAFW